MTKDKATIKDNINVRLGKVGNKIETEIIKFEELAEKITKGIAWLGIIESGIIRLGITKIKEILGAGLEIKLNIIGSRGGKHCKLSKGNYI